MSIFHVSDEVIRSPFHMLQFLVYKKLAHDRSALNRSYALCKWMFFYRYHEAKRYKGIYEYFCQNPQHFPLQPIGKGAQAIAFKTAQDRALRIHLPACDVDYTADYYKSCISVEGREEWMPVVYAVTDIEAFPTCVGSITEMELLTPVQKSPLYTHHSEIAYYISGQLRPTNRHFMGKLETVLSTARYLSEENTGALPSNFLKVIGMAFFDNMDELRADTSASPQLQEIRNAYCNEFKKYLQVLETTVQRSCQRTSIASKNPGIDLHTGNIMYRARTNELVIIDPLY